MKRSLGNKQLTTDARRLRVLLATSPAPVGAADHGALLGLADDDHAQYVHLSAARTISAQHNFAPESLQAPFLLDSNAQGQTVTGFKADQLNKSIVAGDGLTGGGTLVASRTLSVGAGDGITINADDVALTTPGTLSADSSNSSAGNHTHQINASSDPGAAAYLLKSDAGGNLALLSLGVDTLTDRGGGNLTISPAGDVTFDPTGNDILPYTNYDLNLGAINKKYLTLHAAELWVETLVAQETIATIGGRVLVGPTTILEADLAPAATSIEVKHNQMIAGDVAYMEADGKLEFLGIVSGPTGSGPYTYQVTRNLDGTGANQWYAGDAIFNTGQSGNGFIDLYSVRGIKSASQAGPTIVGNVRNSATFNDWSEHWAIGNLNGLYGYGVDTYGVGLGKYASGQANITIDPTNGLRLRSYTTDILQIKNSDGKGYLVGPLYLDTNGGIFQGTGSFASPTTGLKIWNDGGIGRLAGYSSGTLQVGFSTAGELEAGGGNVVLNAAGVATKVGTSYLSTATYQLLEGSTLIGGLSGSAAVGANNVRMNVEPVGSDSSNAILYAESGGTQATVQLRATRGGGTYVYLDILSLSTGNIVELTGGDLVAHNDIYFDGTLQSTKGATDYDVYAFHPLQSPLTSTSWDGDAKTTADNGIIDLSAVFGVPANVKAVLVRLAHVADTAGRICRVGPTATNSYTVTTVTPVANVQNVGTALVPCDANGDIYFYCSGDTDNVYLQIHGYCL